MGQLAFNGGLLRFPRLFVPVDSRITLIDADQPFCLMGTVILLRPAIAGLGQLLAWALRSAICRNQIAAMSGGTAVQALLLRDIRRCAIPLPPRLEGDYLVDRICSCDGTASGVSHSYEGQREALQQLDSAILAKAFRDELVPQDPNDEPASAFLERIRAERESGTNSASKPKPRVARAAKTAKRKHA